MSTCHAIMELIEDISNAADHTKHAVSVFIDLKKAFDTVDHGTYQKGEFLLRAWSWK